MWIGLAIVAVSVVLGARLLAAADDTVAVWSVAETMGEGDVVTRDDLVASRVRFADEGDLAAYFTADETLPSDLRLARSVGAGELLARSAVDSTGAQTVQVPIAVEVEQVPPSVGPGSVVDVYLLSPGGASGRADAGQAAPALAGVSVVDAPPPAESFGTSGKRQLVLAVPEDDAPGFFARLGASEAPVLTVVRRG